MSAAAVIDSLEFARSHDELRGSVAVASLGRLEDVLFDRSGEVGYVLRGTHDGRNRPLIGVELDGALNLRCQRCLGRLEFPLVVDNALRLVLPGETPDPEELEDPEAPDVIEAQAALDVHALVEDEILLALPFAPRHAEGACGGPLQTNEDMTAAREPSAFAQLAALKQPHDQQ